MSVEIIPQHVHKGEVVDSKHLGDKRAISALMRKSGINSSPHQDRVELSAQARELYQMQSLLEEIKARLKELPDIRQDKVEPVQRKIKEGFYSRREVYEQVAEKLLNPL